MERQRAPAAAPHPTPLEVAAVPAAPPDPAPAVDRDEPSVAAETAPDGEGLWIALLLGLAALLALCVVLTLVAYTRAPVGAPG
jgi:hypothetical protein